MRALVPLKAIDCFVTHNCPLSCRARLSIRSSEEKKHTQAVSQHPCFQNIYTIYHLHINPDVFKKGTAWWCGCKPHKQEGSGFESSLVSPCVCVGSLWVLWMQFRERRVRLVDYCKLDVGVNVIMNGCLSLCVCNKLVTSVGYIPCLTLG